MSNHKTVFICDPEKNIVCAKTDCILNGGNCRATTYSWFRDEHYDWAISELNSAFYSNSEEKWNRFLQLVRQ